MIDINKEQSIIRNGEHIVEIDSTVNSLINFSKIFCIFHSSMFGFWRRKRSIIFDRIDFQNDTHVGSLSIFIISYLLVILLQVGNIIIFYVVKLHRPPLDRKRGDHSPLF